MLSLVRLHAKAQMCTPRDGSVPHEGPLLPVPMSLGSGGTVVGVHTHSGGPQAGSQHPDARSACAALCAVRTRTPVHGLPGRRPRTASSLPILRGHKLSLKPAASLVDRCELRTVECAHTVGYPPAPGTSKTFSAGRRARPPVGTNSPRPGTTSCPWSPWI